jgi:hypothetical protein
VVNATGERELHRFDAHGMIMSVLGPTGGMDPEGVARGSRRS